MRLKIITDKSSRSLIATCEFPLGAKIMTDEEILKTIEASVHATSATGIFFNHVLCVLAKQPGIDIQALIDGIRSLQNPGGDEVFQKIYLSCKDILVSNLERTREDHIQKKSGDT